jgi:hypothetical protein
MNQDEYMYNLERRFDRLIQISQTLCELCNHLLIKLNNETNQDKQSLKELGEK